MPRDKSEFRFADARVAVRVQVVPRGPTELPTPPPTGPAVQSAERAGASHSPDWSTVKWYDGRLYSFTPTQRPIIALLWEAMESGAPAVDQAALLEAAESKCRRLSDLFDRNPAFGIVIVPGYKYGMPMGTYQLAPPSPF